MNFLKQTAIFLVLSLMVLGPAHAADTAVTIKGYVNETTENSGLRLIEDTSKLASEESFDNSFISAESVLEKISTQDSSLGDNAGSFSLLVRRPVASGATIKVEVTPLKHNSIANYSLAYKVKTAKIYDDFKVAGLAIITDNSNTADNRSFSFLKQNNNRVSSQIKKYNLGSGANILRSQLVFTYEIPKDISAVAGDYTSTITFTYITH